MEKNDVSGMEKIWVYILSLVFSLVQLRYLGTGMAFWHHLLPNYDYNIYYLIGNEWMNGHMPYAAYADIKGPFVFLFYGIGSLLTPHSFLGVSVLHAFVLGIGLLYAYKTARLFLPAGLSVLCLLFYMVYTGHGDLSPSMHVLVMVHVTLYHVILWAMREGPFRRGEMFSMGCFVAIVLLMKFNQAAFWVPVCLLVLCVNRLRGVMWLASGFFTVFVPVVAYFYLNDALYAMWHEYVAMALGYGTVPWKDSALVKTGFWLLWYLAPERMIEWVPGTALALGGLYMLFGWVTLWFSRTLHLKKAGVVVLLSALVCIVLANYSGSYRFFHYSYTLYGFFLLSIIVTIKYFAAKVNRRVFYLSVYASVLVLYGVFYVLLYIVPECLRR